MKKLLSIILAMAMILVLVPAVSAEVTGAEKTYVFEMYGNYFKTTEATEQIGDNVLFSTKSYVTFVDGTGNEKAYISAEESKIHTGSNFWNTISIKGTTVNDVAITAITYVPRIRVAQKSMADSKENYITFKFKLGESSVEKNYTIKTETYKREWCGSFAVYANGAYLGIINDYAAASGDETYKTINVTDFDNKVVKLIPDENGYVSLTFYALTKDGTASAYADFIPCCVTFTEVSDADNYIDGGTVAAFVKNNVGGQIETSDIFPGDLNGVEAGTEISLKAVADEGYKFAYWADGDGRVLSEEDSYKFNVYSNIAIYAVFNKIDDASKTGVDFFDGNRDYLGFKPADKGTFFSELEKPACGITGYAFKGWSIDDDAEINGFMRAVALYEDEGNELTDSAITVNGAAQGTKKYGEKVECSDETATAWYLNDKLVAYGTSYTHLAWGSAAITSKGNVIEDKAPAVVLNANGDAYMMEYDKGDYEILEAGILFGNDANKTLSKCYAKARAKNIADHGYFTAKIKTDGTAGMQTVARGYVVYKNGDGICVKYSD